MEISFTLPLGGNFPIIDIVNASCDDILIEAGANVTLNDGSTLSINGDIILESDENLTASFVDLNTNDGVVMTGSEQVVNVERYLTGGHWHYSGTPVTEASTTVFTNYYSTIFNTNLYYYREQDSLTTDWKNGWKFAYTDETTPWTLTPGRGYASVWEYGMTPTINYTGGILNSGTIDFGITYTEVAYSDPRHKGWNLIGNPYPSGLDAEQFIDFNGPGGTDAIEGTLYYWGESGISGFGTHSDYYVYFNGTGGIRNGSCTIVPDEYISSGQGFFVRAKDSIPSGTVTFKNSMRHRDNSYFYKKRKEREFPVIKLAFEAPNYDYNEVLFGFKEDATIDFDTKYDAYKLRDDNGFAFYSYMNKNIMAIQAFHPIESNDSLVIDLGLESVIAGLHKIKLVEMKNIPDTLNVYLIDSLSNIRTNLKKNKNYNFLLSNQVENNRFKLLFTYKKDESTTSIDETKNGSEIDIENQSSFCAYSYENKIFIKTNSLNSIPATIKIYNILGKEVLNLKMKQTNLQIYNSEIPSGYYIININNEIEIFSKKLFIDNR